MMYSSLDEENVTYLLGDNKQSNVDRMNGINLWMPFSNIQKLIHFIPTVKIWQV